MLVTENKTFLWPAGVREMVERPTEEVLVEGGDLESQVITWLKELAETIGGTFEIDKV